MMITSDFSASGSCSAISSADEGKPSGGSPLCISRSISFIRSVLTPSNVTTRASAIRASLSGRATLRCLVLVATTEPRAGLVAALRGPVEPLVHAPHRVHAAGVRGVGVVDDAVLERRARDGDHRHVVVLEVDDRAVEAVRDRRAGRAAGGVLGPEHEVVHQELRAPAEQIRQRGAALVGLEPVLLVDPDPRQLLPLPGQLVAAPGQLLLSLEQLEPRRQPLLTGPGPVLGHVRASIPTATIASATGTSMDARGGSTFWARTRTATTAIQATLMTPSARSITISPTLEPTQQTPNWNPERTVSWQRRRQSPLSGVSS